MDIKEINENNHQHLAHLHSEHHHFHADAKKSCCGDCKGQGSCGKLTKVSSNPETPKDIATFK